MPNDGSHAGPRGPEDFCDDKHQHIVDEIIKRVVRRKGGLPPGSTWQDLRQEALLKLLSWINTGRRVDSPVALFTKLVENCLIDMHRRQQAGRRDFRKEVWIDDPDRSEAQRIVGHEQDIRGKILMDELRDTLSDSDRELFEQVFYKDRTLTEIAEELGVSKQAVAGRLGRIVKRLKPLV